MTELRPVAELLADRDDPRAWDELVQRYAGLVWSVARSFRLDDATSADVTQQVWLTLFEHRDRIKDPERLGAWLATTTRRAAIHVLRRSSAERPSDTMEDAVERRRQHTDEVGDAVADQDAEAQLHAAVRAAFERLNENCQLLLRLLVVEPKVEYTVVAGLVGRPVGSLGPTRRRCLDRLRTLLGDAEEAFR